ncbi:MAG: aldo/keto reductase, partial [Solirubrobacterales bacterium]
YLEENAAAVDVELSAEDLARIDAELPEAAGERYNEAGMASVDG